MDGKADLLEKVRKIISADHMDFNLPEAPKRCASKPDQIARSQEFWIRMLYSSLVDADFLDTEEFFEPERKVKRVFGDSIKKLKKKLSDHFMTIGKDGRTVNDVRNEIHEACVISGELRQGVFSLSAPTGSGKTLSAMAFALNHADKHKLKRVIVVIPFTSIIEQNANVYRDIFGFHNVVEHHSNLDPEKEDARNRLACENWDAPIVVTTSVQFFESLFWQTKVQNVENFTISQRVSLFSMKSNRCL